MWKIIYLTLNLPGILYIIKNICVEKYICVEIYRSNIKFAWNFIYYWKYLCGSFRYRKFFCVEHFHTKVCVPSNITECLINLINGLWVIFHLLHLFWSKIWISLKMPTYETFWENSKNSICLLMRLFLDFFGNFLSHKLASEGTYLDSRLSK